MTPELEAALIEAEALLLEPRELYDQYIVGLGQRGHATFAIYDRKALIAGEVKHAIEDEGFDEDVEEGVIEHFEYNILGSWMGEGTPAFLTTFGDPS